jgi:hypothetical protein
MKKGAVKKPVFASLQTDQGPVLINFDDVKYLSLSKPARTVVVGTSTHRHVWPVSQRQHDAILDESGKRYHIVAANDGLEIHRRDNAHRAILQLITPAEIRVVFPRGLQSVSITSNYLTVNVHGVEQPMEHALNEISSSTAADALKMLGAI